MEHQTVWETKAGNCGIRLCSCGIHYLVIGKAVLKMDSAYLDQVKTLMGSWQRPSAAPMFGFHEPGLGLPMDPWSGPDIQKIPCVN